VTKWPLCAPAGRWLYDTIAASAPKSHAARVTASVGTGHLFASQTITTAADLRTLERRPPRSRRGTFKLRCRTGRPSFAASGLETATTMIAMMTAPALVTGTSANTPQSKGWRALSARPCRR
jgi:hypothetical protein